MLKQEKTGIQVYMGRYLGTGDAVRFGEECAAPCGSVMYFTDPIMGVLILVSYISIWKLGMFREVEEAKSKRMDDLIDRIHTGG